MMQKRCGGASAGTSSIIRAVFRGVKLFSKRVSSSADTSEYRRHGLLGASVGVSSTDNIIKEAQRQCCYSCCLFPPAGTSHPGLGAGVRGCAGAAVESRGSVWRACWGLSGQVASCGVNEGGESPGSSGMVHRRRRHPLPHLPMCTPPLSPPLLTSITASFSYLITISLPLHFTITPLPP
ncbi:hypothetical protein E2C01_071015 [Portunus trituberculatus]|uniref:Uncharacterized protein n=1 Tax=Portunus trituberculatus TaxID=210409 RepID=A0A5B7I6V7_PORTR|nr:hypothetical protein [Portunus trituberculatus]